MAKKKKQRIPKYIQAKIKRPQYKVGDAVRITWLGMTKYGIIERIYERHEEARYMVNAGGTKYPCGIQIKEYRSLHADPGFVIYDSGESDDVIRRKAEAANTRVVENSSGTAVRNTDKGTVSRPTVSDTDGTVPSPKRAGKASRKTSSKPSSSRNSRTTNKTKSTKRKSKNSELDDVIQRQKDFLNGFTKKE